MGPVLGESSFAMAVSKLNDSPEKGWLYLCRAILGVIFFFTPTYLPSLRHRRLLALGVYLYCLFINCDWVLLSFIIYVRIISSCFAKKCFPKYGFSYLRCQLEPKIGTSCLLVSADEKFGTSSTNLSSFQFQTFVKFMLAWLMHAQQNILTSFHFLQQKTYLHNLKKGRKIHVT